MTIHYIRSFTLLFVFLFITPILYPNSIYKGIGILCKTAEEPKSTDPSLYLLSDGHKKSEENIEAILEILKSAEQKGEPFHVLIENTNPLMSAHIDYTKNHNLLDMLIPRVNQLKKDNILKNTIIEDVEIRKVSGIVQDICKGKYVELCDVKIEYAIDKTIPDYIGKSIKEITYWDALDEIRSMIVMVEKTVEKVKDDAALYWQLSNKLFRCYDTVLLLLELIVDLEIDCSRTVLSPVYSPEELVGSASIGITDGLQFCKYLGRAGTECMDVYLLKRIIELLREGSHKKIMVIAGGAHTYDVWSRLKPIKNFKKVAQFGSTKKWEQRSYVSGDELKKLFEISLYSAALAKVLLEQALLEEKKEARKRKVIIGVILSGVACSLLVGCIKVLGL